MDSHIWKGPYRACKKCGAADRCRSGECRPCQKERDRRRLEANPKGRRSYQCQWCEANREKLLEDGRQYREANREKLLEDSRKRKGMLNPHGKRSIGAPCPICQEIMTAKGKHSAVLDHNNITDIVREEICNFCNLTLGMLGADRGLEAIALSEAFTAYLRKHTLSYPERILIKLATQHR